MPAACISSFTRDYRYPGVEFQDLGVWLGFWGR